jgi:exopolysaccharide biosynthesis polyprenyl glycosylphosphotransferase
MNQQRRKILVFTMKFFDPLSMVFCFILAASIQSEIEHVTFGQFLAMRIKMQNFLLFTGFVLAWHGIFSSLRIYSSKRLTSWWNEAVDITKAVSLGTLVLAVMSLVFNIRMVTPTSLLIFWTANCLITILSRLILRFVLHQLRLRGRNLRIIIIVGTNSRAIRFAKKLETRQELGYHITGFVDNDSSQLDEFQKTGYAIMSDLKGFPSFLKNSVLDEVMICLPLKSFYQEVDEIVVACEKQGIIVRVLFDLFDHKMARSKATNFEGEPIVTLYTGSMSGPYVLIKRAMDIVFSLPLVILLLPLYLIVALLIKLTSPGPVFFVQERLGLNKRRFGMIKFRTMVPDADKKQAELEHLNEVSGPVFKIKDDPRITPIGKFLRKTSIDELPQLFNVLNGDMSLVGPRPLPVRDYEGFDQDWHRRRFSVRPGITCLWQISGRSDISFEKWMELDMQYIDNWSLWLDLKILIGTIPAVLKGSGAA